MCAGFQHGREARPKTAPPQAHFAERRHSELSLFDHPRPRRRRWGPHFGLNFRTSLMPHMCALSLRWLRGGVRRLGGPLRRLGGSLRWLGAPLQPVDSGPSTGAIVIWLAGWMTSGGQEGAVAFWSAPVLWRFGRAPRPTSGQPHARTKAAEHRRTPGRYRAGQDMGAVAGLTQCPRPRKGWFGPGQRRGAERFVLRGFASDLALVPRALCGRVPPCASTRDTEAPVSPAAGRTGRPACSRFCASVWWRCWAGCGGIRRRPSNRHPPRLHARMRLSPVILR